MNIPDRAPPVLVPELGVSDWSASRAFYVDVLGFDVRYDRPEDGFSYLSLGGADLMLDQNGMGRTYEGGYRPSARPFGRGTNLQIAVPDLTPFLDALSAAGHPLFIAPETAWYRRNEEEVGQRQFVVADPDGYPLRFCASLGTRPASAATA